MADGLIPVSRGLGLRVAAPSDRSFLLGLYGSTREDELAVVPWSDDEKAAFVEMQFDAQDRAYREAYPEGEFLVVLENGDAVGRLSVGRLPGELRLIDVIVAPASRGRGIGTALVQWLVERADRDGLALTLHVEPWNPARRLYERLGFESIEVRGIYEFMRRPVQLKTAS